MLSAFFLPAGTQVRPFTHILALHGSRTSCPPSAGRRQEKVGPGTGREAGLGHAGSDAFTLPR